MLVYTLEANQQAQQINKVSGVTLYNQDPIASIDVCPVKSFPSNQILTVLAGNLLPWAGIGYARATVAGTTPTLGVLPGVTGCTAQVVQSSILNQFTTVGDASMDLSVIGQQKLPLPLLGPVTIKGLSLDLSMETFSTIGQVHLAVSPDNGMGVDEPIYQFKIVGVRTFWDVVEYPNGLYIPDNAGLYIVSGVPAGNAIGTGYWTVTARW